MFLGSRFRPCVPLVHSRRFGQGGMDPPAALSRMEHAELASQAPITRHRIEIKVSEAQKDLISRAAAAQGKGLSEFVRTAAEAAARDAVARR